MISSFAQYVARDIQKEVDNYARVITQGECISFEEYKRLSGVIQGLTTAMLHILDLAKNHEAADE